MDYQGNSKKSKEEASLPVKKVEKVVTGEVVVPKKSLGRKFKDLFIAVDLKTVVHHIGNDVLFPALRNMLYDGATEGVKRMIYGEQAIRRREFGGGQRITYNNPISRGYRNAPPLRPPAGALPQRSTRYDREEFILSSREEAALVLERMNDIIDSYEVASVADLNDLVGLQTSHTDNKWGWQFLGDVQIRQIREGYLLDLPPAEPI